MAVLQSEYAKSHDCRTATEQLRKQEGCDRPKRKKDWLVFDGESFQTGDANGIVFDRCPNYYIHRAASWLDDAFELYHWYKSGFLPGHGSWQDQPNKYIEVIRYIDQLVAVRTKSEQQAITNRAAPKR